MKTAALSLPRSLGSSTGKKFLMALSGAALFGFLLAHLAGNLQIFEGQDAINRYAVFLRSLGELLWIARIGLLAAVGVHVWTGISLAHENQAARPVAYARKKYVEASLASRTMIGSGLVVLAFIIYHLLHFTFIKVHPQYGRLLDARGRHDVYSMMVLSFQQPAISLTYVGCLFLLCFHLSHGIASLFQSMGLNNEKWSSFLSGWAPMLAWLLFAGYASIPLAVLAGIVKLPPGVTP